jgi:alpha-tubulin suppressor-like RCC1 family protein
MREVKTVFEFFERFQEEKLSRLPRSCHLIAACVAVSACTSATEASLSTKPDTVGTSDSVGAWRMIAVGAGHTCGLTTSGRAYCWGNGSRGELGIGTTAITSVPTLVVGGAQYASIYAGTYRTCALMDDGQMDCWGFNGDGELLVPTRVRTNAPLVGLAISAANTCGLTGIGQVLCWGPYNSDLSVTPAAVASPINIAAINASPEGTNTCGWSAAGTAYCWGNYYDTIPPLVARRQPTTIGLSAISSGNGPFPSAIHSCGLDSEGFAWCWGNNVAGQLGDGTTVAKDSAVRVLGGLKFTTLGAQSAVTFALAVDGRAYYWGAWYSATSQRPMLISSIAFARLSAADGHACAVTHRGAGYCWGATGLTNYPSGDPRTVSAAPMRVPDPE